MTYASGFVVIIPDKTTISVVSWHQMDTRLTRFVLDARLVLETRLIFETRLLLEVLRYAHDYSSQNFSWAFVQIDPMNVPTKFEVCSFSRS